jgi:hypothetical protein
MRLTLSSKTLKYHFYTLTHCIMVRKLSSKSLSMSFKLGVVTVAYKR